MPLCSREPVNPFPLTTLPYKEYTPIPDGLGLCFEESGNNGQLGWFGQVGNALPFRESHDSALGLYLCTLEMDCGSVLSPGQTQQGFEDALEKFLFTRLKTQFRGLSALRASMLLPTLGGDGLR
jgi:hypothetical protein